MSKLMKTHSLSSTEKFNNLFSELLKTISKLVNGQLSTMKKDKLPPNYKVSTV